ncbi:MAG: hypothetical protein AAGA03_06985 [Planctomycetota bacterium]
MVAAHSRLFSELEQLAFDVLAHSRDELDAMIGASQRRFDSVTIRQSNAGPTIAIDGDSATVLVGPHATSCESSLVSNVAHESVHLHLTSGAGGWPNGLEEGFAVFFELRAVANHYGQAERQRHLDHLPKTYLRAA